MKTYDFLQVQEEVLKDIDYEIAKPIYFNKSLQDDLNELYLKSKEKEWLSFYVTYYRSGSFSRRQLALLYQQFMKFDIPTDNLLQYYYEREAEPYVKPKVKRDLRSLL